MTSIERAFDETDCYVERRIAEAGIPGAVVAVTDREKALRVASFGYADVAAGRPIEPDLMFEIGSIGKSFTNVALMQLRDEGRLDLHVPVSRYLPWFEVQSEYEPITTHHLMTHTSGLVSGNDIGTHGLYEAWALRESRTGAPPGEYFRYSNVGYKTLGFLLEALDGRPYQDAIQARVLDPLGMHNSHPVIGFDTRRLAATGYRSFYDDRPEYKEHGLVPALWTEYGVGDGCQAATVEDMCTYLRMLMNGGEGPTGRVLSEESFGLMTRRAIATQQWGGAWYGYGLTLADVEGHIYLGHGGSTPGFVAAMIADMDDGIGVVVLINGNAGYYGPTVMALHLLQLLRTGLSREEMPPPRVAADLTSVGNASDYEGTYSRGEARLVLTAEGDRLTLHWRGQDVVLERRGEDDFYAPHPDLELFHLEFGRDEGRVVEVFHGSDWYIGEGYSGPGTFDYPEEWERYPGHYRTYNFGLTNFRIVLRKGALLLMYPAGGYDVLTPLDDGMFRIGEDARCPETLHFDSVASGRALRAIYSGCPYYRTYTP